MKFIIERSLPALSEEIGSPSNEDMDETVSRIEKKLEDLCENLKSLTTILENCNGK